MSARRELLAIQKRLWRRLKREIEASIDENPPNVAIYQEEYERDLRRYERVSSKAELVEAAAASDVVYVGDYHTLPHAQKTLVKLLLGLSRVRPKIVLCVELVHTEFQDALDRYMRDALDEERFLREIEYERTWGFNWAPYREVFHVAKRRGIQVVGINSDPAPDKDHLLERDFRAAQVLVDVMRRDPDALLIVFDGDLHVARDHLPLLVDTLVNREKLPARKRVIVHQNAEEIYWQLARERREQEVNVVRLADDAFCVLNASPIEKLHSYLNWVSELDVLEPPLAASSWEVPESEGDEDEEEDDEADDLGAEYTEQVYQMVRSVAQFLDVRRDDLDAFTLFTVNDLDFLDYLGGEHFTDQELQDIKRQILSNESYFIPKGDVIYLADFSIINAAEEATHFLHHRCSGYRWDRPRDLETDFYFRVITEALGFFGSKVIVPTRDCWREKDCEIYVERQRAKERRRAKRRRARAAAGPASQRAVGGVTGGGDETATLAAVPEERLKLLLSQRLTLRASRLLVQHKRRERAFLETGRWGSAGRALTQPAEVHLLLTHMLGHMLGDRLYWGLLNGHVEKKTIRNLFHEPLERRGVALERYLDLVKLTVGVDHGPTRGEKF